jgi:hypothetical protein
MKTFPEAAKFLLETGLLAEINRVVLHPRGLALAVYVHDETDFVTFTNRLYDNREDPEGIVMGDLREEIRAKLAAAEAAGLIKPISDERKKLFPPDGVEPLL